MPVYEFVCRECGEAFEIVCSITQYDAETIQCPKCKSKKVERRWSRVYAVTSKKS